MDYRHSLIIVALSGMGMSSCGGVDPAPATDTDATETSTGDSGSGDTGSQTEVGPHVLYDVARFDQPDFALPYPSVLRTNADGAPRAGVFFAGGSSLIFESLAAVEDEKRGFSPLSTIYFRTSEPIEFPRPLPARLDTEGPAVLVNVSEGSQAYGTVVPLVLDVHPEADDYWDDDTVTLRPLSSAPMVPGDRYVAALMTGLETADGRLLERGPGFSSALEAADDHAEQLRAALEALDGLGFARQEVLALTVFDVDDVHRIPAAVQQASLDADLTMSSWDPIAEHEGYSVLQGTAQMPEYLSGAPPFLDPGTGTVDFDGDQPVIVRTADVRMHLVVPEPPTPSMPLVVYRHGTGGDAASHHASPDEIGPVLAAVGIASVGYDAALHGERNGGPYDALGRSLANFVSTRDFLFQASADLVAVSALIEAGSLDGVDGQGRAVSLSREVVLFGHSQGTQEIGMLLGAGVAPVPAGVVLSSAAGGNATIALEQEFAGTKIICLLGALQPICDQLYRDHPVVNIAYQASIDPTDPIHSAAHYQAPMLVIQGAEDIFTTPNGTEAIMTASTTALIEPAVPHSDALVVDSPEVSPWPIPPGPDGVVRGACQYPTGHFAYRERADARDAWRGFIESVVAGDPTIARCQPR
ncbi:MAG: hypothetical protein K0V04_06940 [Deltaproteobacteria bacterium]|nr:hypothetical protein [Deltaproteobacteria bacterium]